LQAPTIRIFGGNEIIRSATLKVTIVSQKARYRRQASLCYEIAAMMSGERVAAMVHLGDVYAGLASAPDGRWSVAAVRSAKVHPECPQCGSEMERTHSLPQADHLPAREAFQCTICGETLVSKKA
jgi:hypothetical protein